MLDEEGKIIEDGMCCFANIHLKYSSLLGHMPHAKILTSAHIISVTYFIKQRERNRTITNDRNGIIKVAKRI